MSRSDPLRVSVLVYDGLCAFEFGIVHELFGLARPEFERWYDFSLASMDPGPLAVAGGLRIEAPPGLRKLDHAGTVVIPGWRDPHEEPPEAVLRKLVRAHERGARIVTICSGVFLLGWTGLLDGKSATTHWRYASLFARLFPDVHVDPNVLYVDEGSILTSAGSAAGIDLGLHLIRRDFGAAIANRVARRLVVPAHRDGGQSQFIDYSIRDEEEEALTSVLDWLRANLRRDHTVESIARRAKTSPRTLSRRFAETLGTSPHAWLTRERVRLAERLLETTRHSMERIATECGFGSAQLLRHHFRLIVGTTPTEYRRSFRHRSA